MATHKKNIEKLKLSIIINEKQTKEKDEIILSKRGSNPKK